MAAFQRHRADGVSLDLGDMPYSGLRILVAKGWGVAPSEVDRWPVADFMAAVHALGIDA